MSNEIMIEARELFGKQKYIEAVKIGICQITKDHSKSAEQFTSVFLNLAYSLYAASELDLFDEFQKIFSKYLSIVQSRKHLEPPNGYHNNACLFQHHVKSTIFAYYFGNCRERDIRRSLSKLEYWSSKVPDYRKFKDFNSKIFKLISLIEKSKPPYFIVSFRIPFSLPLPDGEYQIGALGNIKSVRTKTVKLEDVTSAVGDRYFSKVFVKVIGFTSTSNYWAGPSLEESNVPFNLNLCLEALNKIIFLTKLTNENTRIQTISHQDIGQSTTTQYNGDGEEFHSTINLGFGGDSLVDVTSKQELNAEEIDTLTTRLASSPLELHEELYSEALIELSNENMTGSFYLLNSSIESLIERVLFEVSKTEKKVEEYESFMQGKSFCVDCELFKKDTTNFEPTHRAMAPSLFSQLNFLKTIGAVSKTELRELNKLLIKIRNDSLRNSLIHGRINKIPHRFVYDAIQSYKEMRQILFNKLK